MNKRSIRSMLVFFSFILLGTMVSTAQAQTYTVAITQSMLNTGLSQFNASQGVASVSVVLGANLLTINATLTSSGQSLKTVSTWVPSLSQGQLIWSLTSATANGTTASSSTINTLNSYSSELRSVIGSAMTSAGYAYPQYIVQSYKLTAQAFTLTAAKNTNGQSVPTPTKSKSGKATDIPVSGTNSSDDEAVSNSFSQNWAGYVVLTNVNAQKRSLKGDIRLAAGQWTIPSLACTDQPSSSAIWVGIDGYSDPTVEQAGTSQDCVNGIATYSAWFEIYPRPSHETATLDVQAGDQISAEIRYDGADKFTITLKDITSGKQATITRSVPLAGRRSAEWIVEAPLSAGQILPLANFDTVQFSAISVTEADKTDGISGSAWTNKALVMLAQSSIIKAQPSPLSADGHSFDVSWQAPN